MKKTKEQQYKFEDFERHISLWNAIPAASGNSLVLLRKIVDGIQSNSFGRTPSLLIAGDGAELFCRAVANSLCSSDIREIEAKYLMSTRDHMRFYSDSLFETIHIVHNPGALGLNESILWHFIKKRQYKFSSFDGKNFEYIHVNGMIIICSKDIKLISPQIIKSVDFKCVLENFTSPQLELLVHQRLHFCGIDYGDDGEVLKAVVEFGCNQLSIILELIKICVLMVQSDGEILDLRLIRRASKLI